MATSLSVLPFVVRCSDGSVDSSASIDKFKEALEVYLAEQQVDTEVIGAAFDQVWSSNPGLRSVSKPALVSMIFSNPEIQKIAGPSNASALMERITMFINSCETPAPNGPRSVFTQRGPHGGTFLWSRLTDEEAARLLEKKAKKAAKE